MAKEETGDEWHAQNKLSLTVFGCTVYTPGRRNFNFLLVSEVLDHDSQMARLLLTRILNVVREKPAYAWDKVRRIHLVCDCCPHFRSRESYAFCLHDLPNDLDVPLTQSASISLISFFHCFTVSPCRKPLNHLPLRSVLRMSPVRTRRASLRTLMVSQRNLYSEKRTEQNHDHTRNHLDPSNGISQEESNFEQPASII